MRLQNEYLEKRLRAAERAASGRWLEVLVACGIDRAHLEKPGKPCPVCGGTDRFSFTDKFGRGDFICRGCGSGDGFDLIGRVQHCGFVEALEAVERACGICEEKTEGAVPQETPEDVDELKAAARERMKLWAQAKPLQAGDAVWLYLKARGIDPAKTGPALRMHPAMEYRDETGHMTGSFPAMLARVTDAAGIVRTLHRTFLDGKGGKAPVDKPKKLLPGTFKGGAVQLGPWPGRVLGIAEGIETALGASQLWGVPVWATLGCTNMAAFRAVPRGVEEVWIFADNDEKFAGQAAGYALAHALAVTGLKVKVLLPSRAGVDWLDELNSSKRR